MTGGAVRIKCGKVSRLLSVFEGIQGPKYFFSNGLLEPIPCATRVNWNKFFVYFLGEVVTTLTRKVFLKQLSRRLA